MANVAITNQFAYFDSLETLNSLKLSVNKANTQYCLNCDEIPRWGTPDMDYETLVFIGSPRCFWTHGKLFDTPLKHDGCPISEVPYDQWQAGGTPYTYARYFSFYPNSSYDKFGDRSGTSSAANGSQYIHSNATAGGYVYFSVGDDQNYCVIAKCVENGSVCKFHFWYNNTHWLVILDSDDNISWQIL